MRYLKTLSTALLLLLYAAGHTQQTHAFSLKDALAYAEKNNVQVKNALLDIKLQEQVNREVTGSAYPQISASSQTTYNAALPTSLVPAQFFGGEAGQFARIKFGVKWSATGGVTLSQLLFDGQVFTGLKARKTLMDFSNANAEVVKEAIRTNITKIYYQLVVGKTQISLYDSTIALISKNLHDTKIMYDNGLAEMLDIDKLNVQLSNTNSLRAMALNQINNGYLGLKVLMGMQISEELILTDVLTDDAIKEGALEIGQFDYTQRRDYQYAKYGMRLQEYNIQRYKLSKIPTLSLSGYYNEMAQSDKFDIYSGHSYWSPVSAFSLNLHIPIFTGFTTNAKIQQEKIKLEQSQNQVDALKLNIDNEVLSSTNTYKTAISDMDYQKLNMRLAEKVYNQTKKKYEVGTGTQLEIDAARVQLQTAQTNYYTALYTAVIAKVDLLKATGKL